MARRTLPRCLAALVLLSAFSASAQTTAEPPAVPEPPPNISQPAYRDLRMSAYSLPAKTFSFETRLLGLAPDEMFASLGFDYGLGKGVQVGLNVAHFGVGLLNLSSKWTFLERGPVAVAVGFDPVYIHGDWLWVVRMKELFAGIDTALFPVHVAGSFLATPWLQFDLSARYTAGVIVGSVATTNVDLDADLTAQEFALQPGVRIHLLGRSTLSLAAGLPLYRSVPATANLEVELGPGIALGGSLDGTRTKSLGDTYRIEVGVRSMVTKHIFLEFGLNFGPQIELVYGSPVYPRFGMEARF